MQLYFASVHYNGSHGLRPLASAPLSILDPHQDFSRVFCCNTVSWRSYGFVSAGQAPSHAPTVYRQVRCWGRQTQRPWPNQLTDFHTTSVSSLEVPGEGTQVSCTHVTAGNTWANHCIDNPHDFMRFSQWKSRSICVPYWFGNLLSSFLCHKETATRPVNKVD